MGSLDPSGGPEYRILLVDDEENILHALKRVLRREGYEILTATSSTEALGLLAANRGTIGVVISDFKMPGMNGVEFLSRVKAEHPDTIRIILSGYADADVVRAATNEGQVYRFVTKPWEDEELKTVIRSSIQQHEATRITHAVIRQVSSLRREMKRFRQQAEEEERSAAQSIGASDHHRHPKKGPSEGGVARSWQQILNSVPAALLGVDTEETIVFANPLVEAIFGLDPAFLLGASAEDALPPDLRRMAREVMRPPYRPERAAIAAGERAVHVECVPLRPSPGSTPYGVLLCGFVVSGPPAFSSEGPTGS